MRDSKSSGKKPIKEVQEPRARKPKLERVSSDIAERKKAEEELRQSEEFLANMIDALDDPVFVKDQQHRWAILNDAACKVMGRSREELIGKSDSDLFSKRQAEVFWQRDDFVLKSGQTDINEEEITWHGKLHTISTKKSLFTDSVTGKKFIVGTIRDITDRKRPEQALRESEEKFRNLAELSPNMIFINQNGKVVYANNKCVEVMGYRKEEFYSADFDFLSLVAPEYGDLIKKTYVEHMKGRETTPIEYPLITKAGKRIEVLHTSALITYRGETAILGTDIDITERKKAEQALAESEKKYRELIETSLDMIFALDVHGNFTFTNRAWTEHIGYSCDEANKMNGFDLVHPDDLDELKKRFANVIKGASERNVEFRSRTKKGNYLSVLINGSPIFDSHGDVIGVLGAGIDITDRKRAKEALSSALAWQEAVFEGSRDAVFVSDADSRFVMVNRAACELTGFSKDELLGMRIPDLHEEEDLVAYDMYHDRIMAGEEIVSEARILRKDGTKVDTEFNNRCIEISGTAYMHTVARDITERKRMEDALRLERDNFTNILDSMEDGVYIVDQNYDVQYVNPALKKDFGPCEGRKCYEYFHDRKEVCPWCKNKEVFAGKTVRWEWYSAKNQRTYDLVDTPLRNHDGSISKLEIFRDITDRKQAEEDLRDSEETARAILNATYDLAFLLDTEGTMLALNETFAKRFGKRVDELVGSCVYDLLPPDVAAKRKAQGDNIIRSGQPLRFEDVRQGRYLDNSVYPVFDANGKVERLAVFSSDITERKQAEEALKESEERLRRLLETMTEGVVLIASDGQIVYANPASECIAGLKRSEIEGHSYDSPKWDILRPDGTPMPPEEWAGPRAMKEKRPVKDMVMGVRRPDGSICWINLTATPIMNDTGEVDSIVLTSADITERKKAEEALRASEERYRAIFEQAADAIVLVDAETGELLEFNDRTHENLGYTREEFRKLKIPDFEVIESAEEVAKHIEKIITEGADTFETKHRSKGGEIRNVQVSSRAISIREKDLVQSIWCDITEHKKAEEALAASELKYRGLFDNSMEGIGLSKGNCVISANKALLDIFGYDSIEEFTRIPLLDHVAPESREMIRELMKKREKGVLAPSSRVEYRILRKDGQIRDLEISRTAISIEGEQFTQSTFRDITESKRAEQKLRESEERLKILFEYAPDGIYLNDLKGNFVDGNKAAEELVGFKREELIGKNFAEVGLLSAGETPKALANLEKVANGEPTGPDEFTLERKDGNSISVEIRTFPVRIKDQILSLGIARDITDRKNVEQKLLEDQVKLKSLASELSLAEERERHRIATELHDRIGQSLVISKMNLEALRKSEYGKKTDETLDEICNLLAQTIADTRTLTFDLSSPILYELGFETAVAEWLTEQIQDKHGIATQFEDDGQPKPLGDDIGVLLFRNVRELLINVVKHAHAHKVKVAIRKVGKKIQVSVEDDGVGFDPAEAASSAAKRAEFGLFSIRQRLEELGGYLEIDSEPGRGCKVTMTAPLKQK